MNRREFVRGGAGLAAGALAPGRLLGAAEAAGVGGRSFHCDDAGRMRVYEAALRTLAGNVVRVAGYREPVLVEGSVYHGVWLECAPQEGLVYSETGMAAAQAAARNNHRIFFALQKEDGQLPCWVRAGTPVAGHPAATRRSHAGRTRSPAAARVRGGGPGLIAAAAEAAGRLASSSCAMKLCMACTCIISSASMTSSPFSTRSASSWRAQVVVVGARLDARPRAARRRQSAP